MKKSLKLIIAMLMVILATLFLVACDSGNNEENTSDNISESTSENTSESATENDTESNTTDEDADVMIDKTLDAEYADAFTVSKAFSSDMVVQRGERLRVWGWADESQNGKKVSGEFMGMFSEAIIENGKWTITFKAKLDACTEMGNTMKIYTDKKTVEFQNVLVGDVYMVIGQSNVDYSVAAHQAAVGNDINRGGSGAIDEDALIRINLNTIRDEQGYPARGTDEVCEDVVHDRGWQRATKANISGFSAIGYYFAYHVLDITSNEVPIGIIEIDGDGRPLGAFMPNEIAEQQKTDTFNGSYYSTTGANGQYARFMYNHYMYPYENYAMAGILWYQGESDCEVGNATVYAENFAALMTYMRSTHNVTNKDFPIYIMELPTIYKNNYNISNWQYMDLGKIRALMGEIPQILENSYLSVSSDLWTNDRYWNNLHPDCKFEQAERMAKLAAAVWYDEMELDEATGPIFESIEYSADKKSATIKFSNVGDGLKTSDGGTSVKGFVAFTNFAKGMTAVKAEITAPDTITVTSSSSLPINIAYNMVDENFYGDDINLCNSYGNPASAFVARKN